MSRTSWMGMTGAAVAAALLMSGGAVQSARAADLSAPLPMAAPASEPLVEWGSGWYLRGDLGVANDKRDPMMRLPGSPTGAGKDKTGLGADLGFGYQFSDFFRADTTIGVGSRAKQTLTSSYSCTLVAVNQNGTCAETASTRVDRYPLLANVYADLGNYGGLRPYLGAGAGVAFIKQSWDRNAVFNGVTPGTYVSPIYGASPNVGKKSRTNFAYALMAGVGYDLRDGLTLDVGYRYLDMGEAKIANAGQGANGKLREHQLRVGLRYRID